MGAGEPAALVLAAGSGTRLRPLTDIRPKALCPVANVPLLDHAITAVAGLTSDIAVNAWHHAMQIVDHVAMLMDSTDANAVTLQVSVESPEALGTAGAIGAVRDWIDGRPLLVHNADAWHQADLSRFVSGWDGERVRLLVRDDIDSTYLAAGGFCGVSLMPWSAIEHFSAEPSGLWEVSWRNLWERDELDLVPYAGPFFDCGTPSDYVAANLTAAGSDNVVAPDAVVEGEIHGCVVWPGARVEVGERLFDVVRAAGGVTVDAGAMDGPSPVAGRVDVRPAESRP